MPWRRKKAGHRREAMAEFLLVSHRRPRKARKALISRITSGEVNTPRAHGDRRRARTIASGSFGKILLEGLHRLARRNPPFPAKLPLSQALQRALKTIRRRQHSRMISRLKLEAIAAPGATKPRQKIKPSHRGLSKARLYDLQPCEGLEIGPR